MTVEQEKPMTQPEKAGPTRYRGVDKVNHEFAKARTRLSLRESEERKGDLMTHIPSTAPPRTASYGNAVTGTAVMARSANEEKKKKTAPPRTFS